MKILKTFDDLLSKLGSQAVIPRGSGDLLRLKGKRCSKQKLYIHSQEYSYTVDGIKVLMSWESEG